MNHSETSLNDHWRDMAALTEAVSRISGPREFWDPIEISGSGSAEVAGQILAGLPFHFEDDWLSPRPRSKKLKVEFHGFVNESTTVFEQAARYDPLFSKICLVTGTLRDSYSR